jgi:hypothetical protein
MDSDVATSAAINSPSMPALAKQHDLRSADHRSHSNLLGFGSGTHENDKGNVLLPTSDNLNFEKAATHYPEQRLIATGTVFLEQV